MKQNQHHPSAVQIGFGRDRNSSSSSLDISHIIFRIEEPETRKKSILEDSCALHGWLGRCLEPLSLPRASHDHLQVFANRRPDEPTIDVRLVLCGSLHHSRHQILNQIRRFPPPTYNGVNIIIRGLELNDNLLVDGIDVLNDSATPQQMELTFVSPVILKRSGKETTVVRPEDVFSSLTARIAPNSNHLLDQLCNGERVKDIISRIDFKLIKYDESWVTHRHTRNNRNNRRSLLILEGVSGTQKWQIQGERADLLRLVNLSTLFQIVQVGRRNSYGMGFISTSFT